MACFLILPNPDEIRTLLHQDFIYVRSSGMTRYMRAVCDHFANKRCLPASLMSPRGRGCSRRGWRLWATRSRRRTFPLFPVNTARQTHEALIARGHVSPFTPQQLIYLFGALHCTLIDLRVDRKKRLVLWPLYLLMKPVAWLWTRKVTKGTLPDTYPGLPSAFKLLTGFTLMFGRSQILFFQKSDRP